MEFIPYTITFVVAYIISSSQYGQDKFLDNFWLLYKSSLSFNIYGIIYGAVAMLIYFFLESEKILTITTTFQKIIYPLIIGFGVRGLLNINFIDIPVGSGNEKAAFGPRLFIDYFEKLLKNRIDTDFNKAAIKTIQKALRKDLEKISIDELIDGLKEYMPLSTTIAQKNAFELDATNSGEKEFVIKLFITQFGFSMFRFYLKGLKGF